MLALSPRKHAPNNGNDRNMENAQKDRPHYIHVANPFQNVQPPDPSRPKPKYSRDQLVDVFQSASITAPDNPLLRQFDIFTEQLLKPLMLSQSSAEEQMACLLLSNGTWTPSGAPMAPGQPGRGNSGQAMPMSSMNDNSFRQQSQRGRGLAMAQRRFPPRPLESDRVDNWRQRPGPAAQSSQSSHPSGNAPPGPSFHSHPISMNEGSQPPSSGGLWQSRHAESRLAPSWLGMGNSSQNASSDIVSPAVTPGKETAGGQFSDANAGVSLGFEKERPTAVFDNVLSSEASKLFVDDITPYWTGGRTQQTSSAQPKQTEPVVSASAGHDFQRSHQDAVTKPLRAVDGESLWNTISHEPPPNAIQPQRQAYGESNVISPVFGASQAKTSSTSAKNLSPISSDPAIIMAKKSAPPVVSTPEPEPEPEQQAWFYVDPSGILQGPFSGQQMEEWDNEGYFPDDLRLRPAVSLADTANSLTDERGFTILSRLRSAAATGKSPFLQCNISPRQLSKEHSQQAETHKATKPETSQPIVNQSAHQHQHHHRQPEPTVKPVAAKTVVESRDLEHSARRQSWGSSLSSISSDADVPVAQPVPPHQKAHQSIPPTSKASGGFEKQSVPLPIAIEKLLPKQAPVAVPQPAVTRIGIALTSESPPKDEEIGWGEEPDEQDEVEESKPSMAKSKGDSKQQQQSAQAQAEKKKRRKKPANKPSEKEAPMDPLLNAEPAEVRRARLAAEQLRIAEENARKLDDKDAVLAILDKQRVLREKEREMERRMVAPKPTPANRPPSAGPPALPATAKWAVSSQPAGWGAAAKVGGSTSARPASLLEIQRQEALAEASERVQEDQKRTLAATIAASTQSNVSSSSLSSSAWPLGGGPTFSGSSNSNSSYNNKSSSTPWGSDVGPPLPSNNRKPTASSGFWDDGDDGDFRPLQQQSKPVPKLSNILGSGGSSSAQSGSKSGKQQQKDSKPALAPEMSALASWVVSELSRRYAAATSLSPDIVPAFARLLGTIDEISGADELMQRASPYFYRPEDARTFVTDFIVARTRLQQNPSLAQASARNNNSGASPQKQHQPQQPARQQQQQQVPVQETSQGKSKAKKKPIPVNASALFKLVGPPPPAPQPDE